MEVFEDCSSQRMHQCTADFLALLLPGWNFIKRMTNASDSQVLIKKRQNLNFMVFRHCEANTV